MADTDAKDAKSPLTRKILASAIGVVVLGLVYFVLCSPSTDGDKKGGTPGTSGARGPFGTSASAGGSKETPSGSSGTGTGEHPSGSSSSSSGAAPSGSPEPIMSGAPVDMGQLLLEAKTVEAARSALAAGDSRKALKELEFYDKIPNAQSLRQEATLLKIEALTQVGRKADARALAYSTRDDPSFNAYQGRIETLLNNDAGR